MPFLEDTKWLVDMDLAAGAPEAVPGLLRAERHLDAAGLALDSAGELLKRFGSSWPTSRWEWQVDPWRQRKLQQLQRSGIGPCSD